MWSCVVRFVQISLDARKKTSQTCGSIGGRTEFVVKAQEEMLNQASQGLSEWNSQITGRRTRFSSLYLLLFVHLRIRSVSHLWSRQTCFNLSPFYKKIIFMTSNFRTLWTLYFIDVYPLIFRAVRMIYEKEQRNKPQTKTS